MRIAFVFLTLFMLGVASVKGAASSCKELYDQGTRNSGAYDLQIGSRVVSVYCHMGNFGCGNGGWTTVMKIDGNKQTFHYNSKYWGTYISVNEANGKTGFDNKETKLETYHHTPFSKLCLGMKVDGQTRFVVINQDPPKTLYSLIADEQFKATNLGVDTWKSLIGSQASLQLKCKREGYNAKGDIRHYLAKARIGIIANQENDCRSPDSFIGFGTGGEERPANTCGNEAKWSADNGDTSIKAMGYILVQ